jgi:thioredoxin 1
MSGVRVTRRWHEEVVMTTKELTTANFDEVVDGPDMVLIDFWASWCGPCRSFGPVYERASDRHEDVVFTKVDTEAQTELAAAFGISSIPTLVIIKDKVVLYAQPGALPEPALEDLISQAAAVDVDDVRRRLAEEEPAG